MTIDLFDDYGRPIKKLIGKDCPGDLFDNEGRPLIVPVLEGELANDHTYSGISTEGTAHEDLDFPEVCFLNSDSEYALTDADAIATMPVVAMASATIEADADGVFIMPGSFVRDDTWDWTKGGTIYASGTAGGLTQTAPTGSSDIVQVIGWALTADIMFFNPSSDVFEHDGTGINKINNIAIHV